MAEPEDAELEKGEEDEETEEEEEEREDEGHGARTGPVRARRAGPSPSCGRAILHARFSPFRTHHEEQWDGGLPNVRAALHL